MQNLSKTILRQQIKNVLRHMQSENRQAQSLKITQKVVAHPVYQKSKRVSIYLSTEHEVNTIDILNQMFADKKEVFVPTYQGNEMKMLKIYDLKDYESLPLTKWKIKQPSPNDTERENPMLTGPLDLILVPGVAFTKSGGRCGHGMGYYDTYLHTYFKAFASNNDHKTFLVGLAFQEQIVDDNQLPLEKHDYPLDFILSSEE